MNWCLSIWRLEDWEVWCHDLWCVGLVWGSSVVCPAWYWSDLRLRQCPHPGDTGVWQDKEGRWSDQDISASLTQWTRTRPPYIQGQPNDPSSIFMLMIPVSFLRVGANNDLFVMFLFLKIEYLSSWIGDAKGYKCSKSHEDKTPGQTPFALDNYLG